MSGDLWGHYAKIDGEYIARMEDLLDLYTEPSDP
ncbi:hypothetical protein LPU83_pLPU83b_0525 (plasmid) [Rhizobium favelukesii]|uniref:Uncharacterized protein n=1 Tax=Rhizobium favelukesii TaxID=348824 RepID=W6S261_9HYPH|nr:hypothetical protein LPU83_pLPU83b_0525 [Rhizobium favelukesii]